MNEAVKAKISLAKKGTQIPDHTREMVSQSVQSMWDDPEKRKIRIAAMRAAGQRKREQKHEF